MPDVDDFLIDDASGDIIAAVMTDGTVRPIGTKQSA
jgi:hypothetical protein